jgi:hypothetical protein
MTEHAQLPRVFVDFNNSDRLGRVRLNTVGTVQDLNRLGIVLHEGAAMILRSFELEAEGTVTYSSEEGMWVAAIDWDNILELPGNQLP